MFTLIYNLTALLSFSLISIPVDKSETYPGKKTIGNDIKNCFETDFLI